MSAPLQVVAAADETALAHAIAARLITTLVDAQLARGHASVVVTGGGIGTACLTAVAAHPARDTVRWSAVDVWWGDERFVAPDDVERNDKGARDALLDHLALDPARVHPIGSTADFATAEEAAADYARSLATAATGTTGLTGLPVPAFDVLMLGIGPEGHVASIFPDSPAVTETAAAAAVHDCPKPPPTRVTLSFPTIQAATEVWILASGAGKSEAVGRLVAGARARDLPAAGATGTTRTLLLADRAALAAVPATP